VYGLKHQKEKRSMDHFARLDVSVKETSVCIVDDTGKIVREVKLASEPQALLAVLKNPAYRFKRIGLEAGPLSQWLFSALAEAGLPVICVETRHMKAVLKAQINKTDRNDARGIGQMIRAGLYRPVHVKTLRSQKLRMLLTYRELLQSKAIAIENDLRGTLRNFGLKAGMVGKVKFEARIKELVENLPDLAVLVEPMLIVRRVLREQIAILRRRLLAVVRDDEVCRRGQSVHDLVPDASFAWFSSANCAPRNRAARDRRGGSFPGDQPIWRAFIFRGSDVVGRRSRDRFRFAGYRTGNVACSRPLGRQQKRRAARHSQARRAVEDSRNTRAAEDSRNTRAAGPDNRVLGSTGRSRNRVQRAHRRPAPRRPHPMQPDRPSPSHLAIEPPRSLVAPRF
jgi:transposase